MPKPIIIFASGGGSNARKIHEHSLAIKTFTVAAIFCNKQDAPIVKYAIENNIPVHVFNKATFNNEAFLETIQQYEPELIVLAGFLLLVPPYLIKAYPLSILNIHPSLLPKYGGPGMYGMHVHKAVVAAKETKSGITIHLVNEDYDKGKIILQKEISLSATDTPEQVAAKVLVLEHLWYKVVVAEFINMV